MKEYNKTNSWTYDFTAIHMKLVMRTIEEYFFHERNNLVTRQTERTLTFFQHYIITHSVWNVTPLKH